MSARTTDLISVLVLVSLACVAPADASGQLVADDAPPGSDLVRAGQDDSDDQLYRLVPDIESDYGDYASSVVATGSDVFVGWAGYRAEAGGIRTGAVEWVSRVSDGWERTLIEPPAEIELRAFGNRLEALDSTLFAASWDDLHVYNRKSDSWSYQSSIAPRDRRVRYLGDIEAIDNEWLGAHVQWQEDPAAGWTYGIQIFQRAGSDWSFHSLLEFPGHVSDICSTGGRLVVRNRTAPAVLTESTTVDGVEIFEFNGIDWSRTELLIPAAATRAKLGSTITCSDDIILVPGEQSAVFSRGSTGWVEEDPIPAPDGILVLGGEFYGEYLYLVQCENVTRGGVSAEEFFIRTIRRLDGDWEVRSRIDSVVRVKPGEEPDNGWFGRSMSFSDDWIVVGAPFRFIDDDIYGEAYIYPYEITDLQRFVYSDQSPEEPPRYELSLTELYPNPAYNGASLTLTLPESAGVDIDVFDMTGRLATPAVAGLKSAGTHSLHIPTENLASGSYLVRICIGRDVACTSRPMIVIR